MMLLPLIYTEQIHNFGFGKLPMVAPSLQPAPEPPKPVVMAGHTAVRFVRVFNGASLTYNPHRIPEHPVILVDEVDAPRLGFVPGTVSGYGPGIPGAMTGGGTPVPPPPPQPPRVEHAVARVVERPTAPMRVSAGVQEAMIVRRVIPPYPPLARQARVSGTVKLLGVIARDGTIQQLQVLSGHPLLVGAAVEAVRQWVYRPTMLSGEPVEVQAPIEVHFNLAQ